MILAKNLFMKNNNFAFERTIILKRRPPILLSKCYYICLLIRPLISLTALKCICNIADLRILLENLIWIILYSQHVGAWYFSILPINQLASIEILITFNPKHLSFSIKFWKIYIGPYIMSNNVWKTKININLVLA